MDVRVCGPNLRDQSKGTFHVHAADCRDLQKYGPGRKLGGDAWGEDETPITVQSRVEVVEDIYADQLREDPDVEAADWLYDFHFAPCVKDLPEDAPAEGEIVEIVYECWIHNEQGSFAKLGQDSIEKWVLDNIHRITVGQHMHVAVHDAKEYS